MPFCQRGAVLLTWCLRGSQPWTGVSVGAGQSHLCSPKIADAIVDVIYRHANELARFTLHSFVVMPNHLHLLISPRIPLPELTGALKGSTAKIANELLGLTGTPFWEDTTYDRQIHSRAEFDRIRSYIEQSPVRARIVRDATDYRWFHRRLGEPAFPRSARLVARAGRSAASIAELPVVNTRFPTLS